MKNIETFFELSNYDSKNITNKGSRTISQADLNKIESEGVTLEFLQGLNVPVYKYKTQITIHGLFPELHQNYLGGYKNLFQNKNLSIGVKWQVVDFAKKDFIYSKVTGFLKGWRRHHNSSEFFIYKCSEIFTDRNLYTTKLEQAKSEISHINRSLFFGNCGVYLSQTLWGGYYLVSYINIGAILEANVTPCIENITQSSMQTILQDEADKKAKFEAEQAERKRLNLIELEERKAKQAPILEAARKILMDAGYELQEKTQIQDGKIYVKIETDTETGCFKFVARKFTKEARQKKWRFEKCEGNDLNFNFYLSYKQETINTTHSGYVKTQKVTVSVPETVAPVSMAKTQNAINIILVNYSDKAVALFGDTKAIKDKIQAIGGRFNPHLTHEGQKRAGWILPKTKETEAKRLINQ